MKRALTGLGFILALVIAAAAFGADWDAVGQGNYTTYKRLTSLVWDDALDRWTFTGTVKIEGGSPGEGKFLQSDAAGVGSWATANVSTHTVASHSDTTATGAETETLTNGSDGGSLHNHASEITTHSASASAHHTKTGVDASPQEDDNTDAISSGYVYGHVTDNYSAHHVIEDPPTDDSDRTPASSWAYAHAIDGDYQNSHHAQSHTVASHSDTTATGAETETLTNGSNADALHAHSAGASHTVNSHSDVASATGAWLDLAYGTVVADSTNMTLSITRSSVDAVGPEYLLRKDRSGGTTSSNDSLGQLSWWLKNDAATPEWVKGAYIQSVCGGSDEDDEEADLEIYVLGTGSMTKALTVGVDSGFTIHLTDFTLGSTHVGETNFAKIFNDSMADSLHRHSELSASDGTPNAAVQVDAAGQVGVGTVSPSQILDVEADAGTVDLNHPSANSYFTIAFQENGVNKGTLQHVGSAFATASRRNNIELAANSGDVIFQRSGGNVGIGTDSPAYQIHTGNGGYLDGAGDWIDASSFRRKKFVVMDLPSTGTVEMAGASTRTLAAQRVRRSPWDLVPFVRPVDVEHKRRAAGIETTWGTTMTLRQASRWVSGKTTSTSTAGVLTTRSLEVADITSDTARFFLNEGSGIIARTFLLDGPRALPPELQVRDGNGMSAKRIAAQNAGALIEARRRILLLESANKGLRSRFNKMEARIFALEAR